MRIDRFEKDIAVRQVSDGLYEVDVDRGWWIIFGPNGGYVAALLLRAMQAAVPETERLPRSMTVHYTAPPVEGPATIRTRTERRGRRLSTVTARLEQEGRLCALALGAFSEPREALSFSEVTMPEVPSPEQTEKMFRTNEGEIPMHARYDMRPCIGAPGFSGSDRAETGGWIRPSEPHAADAALVAALVDAWPPAIFPKLTPSGGPVAVPTIDLSIHFRAPLPHIEQAADDYFLVRFRSTTSCDGFIEEDGEVWSRNGTLLAQSRQLAIVR